MICPDSLLELLAVVVVGCSMFVLFMMCISLE